MHILINRIFWNVTLDDRTHFLISALFIREGVVLRPLRILRQGLRLNIYS